MNWINQVAPTQTSPKHFCDFLPFRSTLLTYLTYPERNLDRSAAHLAFPLGVPISPAHFLQTRCDDKRAVISGDKPRLLAAKNREKRHIVGSGDFLSVHERACRMTGRTR